MKTAVIKVASGWYVIDAKSLKLLSNGFKSQCKAVKFAERIHDAEILPHPIHLQRIAPDIVLGNLIAREAHR